MKLKFEKEVLYQKTGGRIMRLIITISLFGAFGVLDAQNVRYGPSSTEWLQIGHDYKKTRRAPLRCANPANVNRTWDAFEEVCPIIPKRAIYVFDSFY